MTTGGTILPLAGGGAEILPARIIFETTPAPARSIRLPLSGSGSGLLPAPVQEDQLVSLPLAGGGTELMPAAVIASLPLPPQPARPAWQRDIQHWAIAQERQRHVQALWQYGELAVFVLRWTVLDFRAGLVGRCQRCFLNVNSGINSAKEAQIATAYGQGNQELCPDCYGTQFEGGLRAMIVRPALFSDTDTAQEYDRRGVSYPSQVNIESTPDFRVRGGDFVFRSDGARYRLAMPRRTTLRTGFATPWQATAAIDYNMMQAGREDPASVAYLIPPDATRLREVLGTYTRLPVDFSWFEIERAPLIPEEDPPPAASGELQPSVRIPEGLQ